MINQSEAIIKEAANNACFYPGVYKMIDANGKVIYIGKAKHLKNRLMSYTKTNKMPNRLKMMVSNIHKVETIITKTEIEALILENNLIKQFKPFYNILLKDDKTFPYIVIDDKHDFPRIFKYRTMHPGCCENFFGPYPSVAALDEFVKIVQKAFLLRNCSDSYFKNAKRPCLQYFIKRCSAPCAAKISPAEYAKNVFFAKQLLFGKDSIVRNELVKNLRKFSAELEFEKAAVVRDKLKIISEIQSKQYIQISKTCSMDFLAVALGSENSVVFVSFFRCGKNVGSEHFVVQNSFENNSCKDILAAFVQQFYRTISPPSLLVLSHEIKNKKKLEEVLNQKSKTKIVFGNFGIYKKIMETCLQNAQIRLNKGNTDEHQKQLVELAKVVDLPKIDRIETYDNSHISGTNACGSMIVFEDGMLQKSKHRVFNIDEKTANKGDDLSMMKFSLKKRLASKNIPEVPSLILIDGGKTQLLAAHEVLSDFQLEGKIRLLSIAKQHNRKVGDEKIMSLSAEDVPVSESLLNFLIMLRDEAHRKAIVFHRSKRKKTLSKSCLDDIPSIGVVRKRKLLEHFGSVDSVKKASVEDLLQISGIDEKSANIVFKFFND